VKDPEQHERISHILARQWSAQDKEETHESSEDEYVSDGESSGKP
jgi:hypothetical protein